MILGVLPLIVNRVCNVKHLDLFSGIGGFSLAASWVWGSQHELVSFCERDEFCQKVLKKHWPDVPCVDDIHNLRGDDIGTVDILTGGFPCQPFSVAGKRRGTDDDRHLWPEMFRVIQEVQPRWILGENVHGIVNLALDAVLADLESEGYEVQTFLVPACAVNAPHRRNRIWIIANAISTGLEKRECLRRNDESKFPAIERSYCGDVSNAESEQAGRLFERRFPANISASRDWTGQTEAWSTESGICGVADGIPGRMDRLRSLGNAIVPQVAAVFFEMMKRVDLLYNMN